jgi:hydroxyacylglutathione hydrolase
MNTQSNLRFAVTVETENQALAQRLASVTAARQRGESTIPSWIGIEKQTNPFLRWDIPDLMTATQTENGVVCFAKLRGMKDQF